jgi:hypothetical protein
MIIKDDFNDQLTKLFDNKKPHLIAVFDKILGCVIDFGIMEIKTTKNCILFYNNQTFLVVKPMMSYINIKFYLSEFREDFPIYKTALYGKQLEHHIKVTSLDEVNDLVIKLIHSSYLLFQK